MINKYNQLINVIILKPISLILFFILLNGCLPEKNAEKEFRKFPKVDSLSAKVIKGDYKLYDPYSIAAQNKKILISEKKQNRPLRILNLVTNEFDILSIKKGRGPGEVIAPAWLTTFNGRFQALDIVKNTLYKLQLPEEKNDTVSFTEVNIGQIVGDFSQNTKSIFFTGYFSNGRFGRYDKGKGNMVEIGKIPTTDIPGAVYNNAHDGYITLSNDGKRIAIGQRYTDILEIYGSSNGKLFQKVKGPIGKPLKYEPGQYVEAHLKEDNYIGYKALYHYKNNILGMFSGYHMNEPFAYHADKLVVFSWQGQPLKMYQLDRHLLSTALDKKNGYLYGVSAEPETEIVRYALE